MVTLWHFTLPLWAADMGGWESEEVVERFADYAEVMGRALRTQVRLWATLNEPEVYSAEAYLLATWPPQRRSLWRYLRVRRALLRAHVAAYKVLKLVDPDFEVGLCTSQTLFDARRFWLRPAAWVGARIINDYFIDRLAYEADWLGVQYYVHRVLDRRGHGPKNDLGWELYPQGHKRILKSLARFGRPLYVTESGLADAADKHRAKYIEVSLESIAEAMAEGVDCRGYFYWSLLDNFEWHEGFWPKFGLLEVDRETLVRTVRPSARHYAGLVKAARQR
jgi:beta-glucosidase